MRRIGPVLAIALGLGLAASGVAAAAYQEAALGADGEVYQVKSGIYSQLFPAGKDLTGSNRSNLVLALDVVQPDGSSKRTLVPGTEGPAEDRLPYLQYEEAARMVFLVWETRVNLIHPVLMLSGYNGTWLQPLEILGNPFAPKTSPQLAVTHDTFQETGDDGNPVSRHLTTLHLIWGEELDGTIDTFYTPVILKDGQLTGSQGQSPVFRLNDFDTSTVADAPALGPDLQRALSIQQGRDERMVVVAFPSPRTNRLITLEIDALPPQLSQLADEARSHIVDIGAKMTLPDDVKLLADGARSHIVDIGVAFHPEVAHALADAVHAYILKEGPGSGLKVIADGARSHIVDIGAKLSGRGLRTSTAASVATSAIVEVAPSTEDITPPEKAPTLSHLLNVRVVSDRPAPETGTGQALLFVSKSGEEALVAWMKADRLYYRETSGTGWREQLQLRISENLNLDQAFEVLQRRIQNR
jgi:hypothetical protein